MKQLFLMAFVAIATVTMELPPPQAVGTSSSKTDVKPCATESNK